MLISRKQHGFTLTELVIALGLNVMLLSALLTIFLANLDYFHREVKINRFNQQLQMAMDLMANDIRRAGYSATASNDIGLDQNTNPFMAAGADITASGSCIIFTYDHAKNGTLAAIAAGADDDHYGYQLNGNVLQTRPPGATFACNAPTAGWENLTDPNVILITSLTFTLNTSTVTVGGASATRALTLRYIAITMTGRLANDATVTKTLNQTVRLRNDKFIP